MSDVTKARTTRRRITLDGQLMSYWEREAQRLEALAEGARWSWVARGHRRKAERARAQGVIFADREEARTKLQVAAIPEDGADSASA